MRVLKNYAFSYLHPCSIHLDIDHCMSRKQAAKYKYNAWKELREKGVTPPQAQKEYVQLFETLRAKYGMQ